MHPSRSALFVTIRATRVAVPTPLNRLRNRPEVCARDAARDYFDTAKNRVV
jgi:hypothetical protein